MKQEYLLCAAIHVDDGVEHVHQPRNINTGFVICGRRHHNCFATLAMLRSIDNHTIHPTQVQGFLTSQDRFVNRTEGGVIAFLAKQTEKQKDTLMSEDLY